MATVRRNPKVLRLSLAYLGFVSLGMPDGLLGVAWPSIRAGFALPLDALGTLLLSFTAGYLLASFSSGHLLARVNVGSLLALSCLATATSLLGYALTPRWWAMVALGALLGLGAGAIDTGLNQYVATHHSARTLNWLHACFGVGATIGPAVMTGALAAGRPWQWGYAGVGIAQLALAGCFGLTRARWPAAGGGEDQDGSPATPARGAPLLHTLRLPTAWLGIATFFVYAGLEVAAGTWAYTLFTEARAIPAPVAGPWVSAYWGGLTVGRLLFGAIAPFAPIALLLRLSLAGIVAGTGLIWLAPATGLSFLGLALTGLSLAPIFPSLIAGTPARLGAAHAANGIGFQVAAAVLGGSTLPTLVGVLARRAGLESIGPALLAAAVLLLALHEILMAIDPPAPRDGAVYSGGQPGVPARARGR